MKMCFNKMNRLLVFAGITFLTISVSNAQSETQAGNPSGLNPVGWSVDLAYSRDFQTTKSLTYYKISFKGNTISERGSSWSPTTLGQAWGMPGTASDTDEFRFDLLDGISSISSPMYQAYGIKPLEFASKLAGLRGAVQIGGRLTASQELNVGVGLETKPLSFLPGKLGVTNQIRIGAFGMKHSENASSSKDFFTFNYRAYVGVGFNYQRSANVDELTNALASRLVSLTTEEMDKLIASGSENDPIVPLLSLLSESERKDPIRLREAAIEAYSAKFDDQPGMTLEFSADGSYAPDAFVRRRYNSLWSVSFQWWPNPRNPDSAKFFVTYQNGFARGDTENPISGIIVGLGIKF